MDRCYFEITCRSKDVERFERRGFNLVRSDGTTATMEDAESGDSLAENMPKDIPWHGRSYGHQGAYGPAEHACDGRLYISVEAGHSSGFVVEFENGNIAKVSRDRIIAYRQILNRAKKKIAPVIKPPRYRVNGHFAKRPEPQS